MDEPRGRPVQLPSPPEIGQLPVPDLPACDRLFWTLYGLVFAGLAKLVKQFNVVHLVAAAGEIAQGVVYLFYAMLPFDLGEPFAPTGTSWSLVNVSDPKFVVDPLITETLKGTPLGEELPPTPGTFDVNGELTPAQKALEFQLTTRAALMALLSKLVYEDIRVLKDLVDRLREQAERRRGARHWANGIKVVGFDARGCRYFVLETRGELLVVFRGTDVTTVTEYLVDAFTLMVDHPSGGRVHRGFKRLLDEYMNDDLLELLSARERKDKKIYITGHSLGAALAVLFAHGLPTLREALMDRVVHVLTFGQPLVGDGDFVQAFERNYQGRVMRYVNYHDIVPRVPFWGGYRHTSAVRHIDYKTELRAQANRSICGLAYRRISKVLQDWGIGNIENEFKVRRTPLRVLLTMLGLGGLDDHSPCEYARNLDRWLLNHEELRDIDHDEE